MKSSNTKLNIVVRIGLFRFWFWVLQTLNRESMKMLETNFGDSFYDENPFWNPISMELHITGQHLAGTVSNIFKI
jgi:hypothetical protein